MKLIPITLFSLGVAGIKTSKPRELLQETEAWVMSNIRPFRGKIETVPGIASFIAGTLQGTPKTLISWLHDDNTLRLNIVTNTKAYKITPSSIVDITRVAGDYTGPTTGFVDGTVYGSSFIFTNGVDVIQSWDGAAANCVALGGSPPKCKSLATVLTFLLLAGIENYPRRIQWSDSGSAITWSGNDAGFITLYQGSGDVIRIKPLGEVVIAYRRDNIHLLYFVGPPFIWGQRQIVSSHGLIGPKAVVDLGERHLYWGTDNIYLFDGVTRIPVGTDVIEQMLNSFEAKYQNNIHTAADYRDSMAYFFYPAPGDGGQCKNAWVFDWRYARWHHENFNTNGVSLAGTHESLALFDWAHATGTWDDAKAGYPPNISGMKGLSWEEMASLQTSQLTLLFVFNDGTINITDRSMDHIGTGGREKIFESGFINPGILISQSPATSKSNKWTLNRLDVEYEKSPGTTLEVWIGRQNGLLGDPDIIWSKQDLVLDGTKKKIDVRQTAQFFVLRFRNTQIGQPFRLSGVTGFFSQKGRR